MTCHDLVSIVTALTNTDVVVFVVLIFIAFNLMIVSCYSIYRENYAINPDYLKNTRSVSVATTTLQLICFCGYFSGIFLIQRLATTIWYRLFSLALIWMGLKFAESYILLVSTNYSLHDHNKIPTKYILTIFLVWLIGSCIDITGTVYGFVYVCSRAHDQKLKYRRIAVLCFAIWDLTCLIFLVILMYILKSIQRKFRELLKRKLEYQKDRNESKLLKQANKKKRRIIKSYSYTKAEEGVNDQKYDTNSVNTMNTMNMSSLLPSHTSPAKYTRKTSMSKTIGSINDSVITQRGFIMISEVKRMRILICGLYVLCCIFLFNLLFHGYQALANFELISKVNYIEDMISEPNAIKVWVIAGVYFPQWIVINVFVMGFSWIPGSQMLPQWTE